MREIIEGCFHRPILWASSLPPIGGLFDDINTACPDLFGG